MPCRLGLFLPLDGRRPHPAHVLHHTRGACRPQWLAVPGDTRCAHAGWGRAAQFSRTLCKQQAAGHPPSASHHPRRHLPPTPPPLPLPQLECNVATFAAELGEADTAAAFTRHAEQRLDAINSLLWDAGAGQWRDLVMAEGPGGAPPPAPGGAPGSASDAPPPVCTDWRQSGVVAASNWVPLYCGCAAAGSPQAAAAVAGLRGSGLVAQAGVAVTLTNTGQQWDWPNCWPPLTCMLLEGCREYGGEAGAQVGGRPGERTGAGLALGLPACRAVRPLPLPAAHTRAAALPPLVRHLPLGSWALSWRSSTSAPLWRRGARAGACTKSTTQPTAARPGAAGSTRASMALGGPTAWPCCSWSATGGRRRQRRRCHAARRWDAAAAAPPHRLYSLPCFPTYCATLAIGRRSGACGRHR